MTPEARNDPAVARRIIEQLIPSAVQRGHAACALADAILCADNASGCWSVTLTRTMIRVNVGGVEVFALFDRLAHFVVDSGFAPAGDKGKDKGPEYERIPRSAIVDVSSRSLARRRPRLQHAWDAAIKSASETGKNRYAKAHSPGVLKYLREELARDIPDPPIC